MIYTFHSLAKKINKETFLLSMLDRQEVYEEPWDVAEEKMNYSESLVSNNC